MKTKQIISIGMIGLGIVSQADASVFTNYITGSTAFRSAAFKAIKASYDAVPAVTFATRGGTATDGSNGQWMLFHGSIGGNETWVDCFWSGSEYGIASLGFPGANPTFFLKTDGTVPFTIVNTIAPPPTGETNSSASVPDFCFADNSKAVSRNPTAAITPVGTHTPAGAVGVIPFTWVKNTKTGSTTAANITTWGNITNITSAEARNLLAGPQKASSFSGLSADSGIFVYCVGRNHFSGTRVNTLSTTQYGIFVPVDQFSIGGLSQPTTLLLAEVTDDGYDIGGDVAAALTIQGSLDQVDPISGPTGWMAIGYAGIGDANTVKNGGGAFLSYEGVNASNGAIQEAQYNFWNYEYMYVRNTLGAGSQLTWATTLANTGIDAQAGGVNPAATDSTIKLSLMNAAKASDTADPTHN
jgi:hypothetical protein